MVGRGLKILYLVHDLSDAAAHKRVVMLKSGGADVTLAGFRRTTELINSVAGCHAINLGQTYNGGFIQRSWSVLREVLLLGKYRAVFQNADVIMARNLEMLAIGVRGKSLCIHKTTLVYESLDIHRLLLKNNVVGSLLRCLEGWLSKRASLLITSSPAFIREYFETRSKVRLPVRLVENKVFDSSLPEGSLTIPPRPSSPPWRIGWFGIIRCRKSLQTLINLVEHSEGKIEVVIRGKPALDQFEDFHKSVSAVRGVYFHGAYRNPDDLAKIYSEVHFTWAIDHYEEGMNSSWLLPNRIYEGSLYGTVPIAIDSVETGRFLRNLGLGVIMRNADEGELTAFFSQLTPESYQMLQNAIVQTPQKTWKYSQQDCQELVQSLRTLATHIPHE